MQYGFVKCCAATVPIRVADVEYNCGRIIAALKEAAGQGAQVTVFPELCVSGYTCGDLFNQRALIEETQRALINIAQASKGVKSLVFVGAPIVCGGKLYNCGVAISNGKILGVVPKSNIPDYGEFYEGRHFTAFNGKTQSITIGDWIVPFGTDILFTAENCPSLKVACEICEDLWVPNSPSARHAPAGATVIVNLSCSNEVIGKSEYRRSLISVQSAKLICGYVYCDAGEGESTTDTVFAGHSLICENASVLAESRLFENSLLYGEIDVEKIENERRRTSSAFFGDNGADGYVCVDFETDNSEGTLSRRFSMHPFVPESAEKLEERTKLILTMKAKGLEKRLAHTKSKTAVIGISGGLDSALALLVTRRAFKNIGKPLTDIIAVTMPGFGTSARTFENSKKLVELSGATLKTVPIGETVLKHFQDIGHDPACRDVTYENAQARMRTLVLMDIANQTGGLVVGTGDLSELALGWATYNGDHMSMYGVNASVPKTLVKHLVSVEADLIGGECGKVLKDVVETEISPELLPPDKDGKIAQKTEDLVGPYALHDFFLYYIVRWGFCPQKVLYLAKTAFEGVYTEEEIKKWLKRFYTRFFAQQFKRSCLPDGVKVGSVALSPRGDWRMPSDAVAAVWLNSLE